MKLGKKNKIYLREARRRTKDDASDMGKFDMRPRDPYEILGLIRPKRVMPAIGEGHAQSSISPSQSRQQDVAAAKRG
jgi:hypothetical protein